MTEIAPQPPQQKPAPKLLPMPGFRPAGNPSLPTFVALMLIVTTFMIVLASISLHDASKLKNLLDSMRATFGSPGMGDPLATAPDEAAAILADGAAGFRAAVPATLPAGASGTETLVLVVPVRAALDPQSGAVTSDFARGLEIINTALGKRGTETAYRVELRFGRDGDEQPPQPRADYAAKLAAAAGAAGLETDYLTIGSGPGPANQLSLRIDLVSAGAAP